MGELRYRVTLWIEQDNLVVSFDHPWLHEYIGEDENPHDSEFDTDGDSPQANSILEYMAQSDSWSGLFYDHYTVTRVKVEMV